VRNPAPDRLDMSCQIEAEYVMSRPRQAHPEPDDERLAAHQHSVCAVDRRRPNAHENLALPRLRGRHVRQLEHVRAAVASIDESFHGAPTPR